MGLDVRKPVSGVCEQQKQRPACAFAQTEQRLYYSRFAKYSQISVIRTPIIQNYWVIRRRWTVPIFFSIIYCNKTTNYSNFDYPKNSIFRSDSSVPIEEVAIKLPFKIRSPNVTHGDHDFFVWSSSIYTPE